MIGKFVAAVCVLLSITHGAFALDANTDAELLGLRTTSPAQSIVLREALKVAIWGSGSPTIPGPAYTSLPDGKCCGAPTTDPALASYFGRAPSYSVWLPFNLGTVLAGSIWQRSYFASFPDTTCLAVYIQGHGGGYFRPSDYPVQFPEGYLSTGTLALLRQLAAGGCDLLLVSMPHDGENVFARGYVGVPSDYVHQSYHGYYGLPTFQPSSGSPIQFFVTTTVASMNWALARRSYDKVAVLGLSGGGWTTTIVAALDPRVTHSYAMAGSQPLDFRKSEGDWEQLEPALWRQFDYSDLYLMAVAEPARKAMLLYGRRDPCCFSPGAVTAFGPLLLNIARTNGYGPLSIKVNKSSVMHDVEPEYISAIVGDLFGP